MTLYERALVASEHARAENERSAGDALKLLKAQVEDIVSVDTLALMAQQNPHRARNEVRSACLRVFASEQWASYGSCERDRLLERLLDSIFGFGALERLIEDESITEVMVNGPRKVFFEREGKLYESSETFSDESELRALVDRILGPLGRRIDEASPMVNARLPQGHRVNVVVSPVAMDGPFVTIRKFSSHVITLDEMQESGSLDAGLRQFLSWAVAARQSIAVSGGTGSGKTTLLNALSCEIPDEERIVTIEDSAELRFLRHPHVVRMEARPRNAEGEGEITIRDLVTNSLRMRPDRIIVGEVRNAEALDMLQAMSTGHDGSLTTLHANSPAESVSRLATMVRFGADLPTDVVEAVIASAIDLVIQTQRTMDGRRLVTEVVRFEYSRESRECIPVQIYRRADDESCGTWFECPAWIDDMVRRRRLRKKEVASWKHMCSLE